MQKQKLKIMEWISVKDGLPDVENYYLVVITYGGGNNDIKIELWNKNGYFDSFFEDHITHWMPLPEPPKN